MRSYEMLSSVIMASNGSQPHPIREEWLPSFLQQRCAMPLKEVYKFFCILVFKP